MCYILYYFYWFFLLLFCIVKHIEPNVAWGIALWKCDIIFNIIIIIIIIILSNRSSEVCAVTEDWAILQCRPSQASYCGSDSDCDVSLYVYVGVIVLMDMDE